MPTSLDPRRSKHRPGGISIPRLLSRPYRLTHPWQPGSYYGFAVFARRRRCHRPPCRPCRPCPAAVAQRQSPPRRSGPAAWSRGRRQSRRAPPPAWRTRSVRSPAAGVLAMSSPLRAWWWWAGTYLDVAASPVQVEVQVLDLAKVAELVLYGLLVGLFVDVCDNHDPALDGSDGRGLGVCLHFGFVACRGRRGSVDVHVYVGHGFGLRFWSTA